MPTSPRQYSPIDNLLMQFDQGIRTLFGEPKTTERPNPAAAVAEQELTPQERKESAAMMRINHAGEVCAQALYQGQALTSRLPAVREQMQQAAIEENDHLAWCKTRLQELHSHTSYLNPVWYVGSLAIGTIAGLVGDKWSLGFVAETEQQVVKHLTTHLQHLPMNDLKSQTILLQMQLDETKHRDLALQEGAATLPRPIQIAMSFTAKIMVKTAYYL